MALSIEEMAHLRQKDTFIAGASYLVLFFGLLGLIIDIVIYYSVKNRYARFHASQAAILELVLTIIGLIVLYPIIIGALFGTVSIGVMFLYIITTILIVSLIYIVLAILAFQGKEFKIPFIGDLAGKQK